jgi:hypothetical protein
MATVLRAPSAICHRKALHLTSQAAWSNDKRIGVAFD